MALLCYNLLMRAKLFVLALFSPFLLIAGRALAAPGDAVIIDLPQKMDNGIELMEPIGSQTNVTVTRGFGTLLSYFNDISSWLVLVVGGICVLWVLIGGFRIMLSGYDSSQRSKGMEEMKWAIAGLAILFFAGFILRTLNSQFFK